MQPRRQSPASLVHVKKSSSSSSSSGDVDFFTWRRSRAKALQIEKTVLKMNRQKSMAEVGRNRRICRFMRVTAALGVLASISVLPEGWPQVCPQSAGWKYQGVNALCNCPQNMTGGS